MYIYRILYDKGWFAAGNIRDDDALANIAKISRSRINVGLQDKGQRIKLVKSISPNAITEFNGIFIWNILFSLCSLFSTHTQTDCPRYQHIHPMDLSDHSYQCNIEIVHLHLECG